MSLSFQSPWFLALLLLPFVWAVVQWRRGGAWRVSIPTVVHLRGLKPTWRSTLRPILPVLRLLGLCLLVVALARPVGDRSRAPVEGDGIDIALVVDVSGSMKAEDLAAGKTRLAVVKDVVRRFVEQRRGDRMGLVAFAKYPMTACPLTLDASTVAKFVERLEPAELHAEDGTAIGRALAHAVKRLRKSRAKSRIVVLLTDGANNVHDITPEEAADLAAKVGIRVYTVLAGRESGARVTMRPDGDAVSRPLIDISRTTGGRFYRAEDASALEDIYREIDKLEKSRIEEKRYETFTERFRPFASTGILLLVLAALGEHTWLRRLP